jgi:hypothetical protein
MRLFHFVVCLTTVCATAGVAQAQYGLYGSPEILRLPQTQPKLLPASGSQAQPSYPATAPRSLYPTTAVSEQPSRLPAAPARSVYATAYPPADPGYSTHLVQAANDAPSKKPAGAPTKAPKPQGKPKLQKPEPPSRAGGVVDQMLDEADRHAAGGCAQGDCNWLPDPGCGAFDEAVHHAPADAYGCGIGYDDCWQCPWYVGAKGLIMGRNQANKVWTSHDPDQESNQLTNTNDIPLQWRGGGEIRFGREFCCGMWAVEATYWTLSPFSGMRSTTPPGANGVSTPLELGSVRFGVGDPISDYFDNAEEHRLSRRNEFQNVEIALVRNAFWCEDPCNPWDMRWQAGVRFFRFEESLLFGSRAHAGAWGADTANEAYIDEKITNYLVGFQFGGEAGYDLGYNLRAYVAPKIGIYNNHIKNDFAIYRADGTAAQINPASGMGAHGYPVHSTKDVLSFLTEIDLGLQWHFAQRWSASVGYRVAVATGIGLADHQIPFYLVDVPEIADIDHNGELILHGGYAGLEYNF